MEDYEEERETWLLSQLLAVKHCLEIAKRKEHQQAASELHSFRPRKKRHCKKNGKHDALHSTFKIFCCSGCI
jgi:hypothetical protein